MNLGKSKKDVVQSEKNAKHVGGCVCLARLHFLTRPQPFVGLAETWRSILFLFLKHVVHDIDSVPTCFLVVRAEARTGATSVQL